MHHQASGVSSVPAAADIMTLPSLQTNMTALLRQLRPISAHDTDEPGSLLVSALIYMLHDANQDISALLVLEQQGSYEELEKVPGFVDRLG